MLISTIKPNSGLSSRSTFQKVKLDFFRSWIVLTLRKLTLHRTTAAASNTSSSGTRSLRSRSARLPVMQTIPVGYCWRVRQPVVSKKPARRQEDAAERQVRIKRNIK